MNNNILILTGSPKNIANSACLAIEERFVKFLNKNSCKIKRIKITQHINSDIDDESLISAVNCSTAIIIISPLYLDTVPSTVVKMMEFLYKNKARICESKKILAVSICGYPEPLHNSVALRVYQNYAKEMGFKWIGGLSIGQGPAHVYMRSIGGMLGFFRRLDKTILLAIHALLNDEVLQMENADFTKESLIPLWLYVMVATLVVKIMTVKDGIWVLAKRPDISMNDRQVDA